MIARFHTHVYAHPYMYVHMYPKDIFPISEFFSLLLHPDKSALLEELRVQKGLLAERLKERSQELKQKGRRQGCPYPLPNPSSFDHEL